MRDAGLSRKEAMTFISAGKSTLRDVVEEELKNEDVMAQLINLYKD